MNAIGIIVAMDKEFSLLMSQIQQQSTVIVNDIEFVVGRMHGVEHEVVVMKCGIGKVNAAISALTMIENFHVRLIINTGVAGGTGAGAGILDVVVADRVAYHDVWCGPGTVEGQAANCPRFFECPLEGEVLRSLPGIKHGLIASGDIFVSRTADLERIKALYPDVMAVDMESAAIAQVCHLKNVPFLAIRVISDTPGQEDNIRQYENFWVDAPRSTFEALTKILNLILK